MRAEISAEDTARPNAHDSPSLRRPDDSGCVVEVGLAPVGEPALDHQVVEHLARCGQLAPVIGVDGLAGCEHRLDDRAGRARCYSPRSPGATSAGAVRPGPRVASRRPAGTPRPRPPPDRRPGRRRRYRRLRAVEGHVEPEKELASRLPGQGPDTPATTRPAEIASTFAVHRFRWARSNSALESGVVAFA